MGATAALPRMSGGKYAPASGVFSCARPSSYQASSNASRVDRNEAADGLHKLAALHHLTLLPYQLLAESLAGALEGR